MSNEAIFVRLYYANNNSATEAIRAYRRETGAKSKLNEHQVRRLVEKLEQQGNILGRKSGSGNPTILRAGGDAIDQIDMARNDVQANHPYGMSSVRAIANHPDVSVSKSTVHRYLRDQLNLKPYRPLQVQELLPGDLEKRVEFAKRSLERFGRDMDNILWTDESIFRLQPHVSSLQGSIWTDEKPNVLVEKSLHPAQLHVWMGFSGKVKLEPYFFRGNVTAISYNEMLQTHCIPQLKQARKLSSTTFQQDGAPPHIGNIVKETLRNSFGSRVISRHFDFPWPPRSPDLTPLDFFLWGYIKPLVYRQKVFQNLDDLEIAIREVIDDIPLEMLLNVAKTVPDRLERVIQSGGIQIKKM